jgi:LysR family transcriptional regulator, hydrogen peroxide-inducible genes activator
MEMRQIRYFLALCEELNFTRAARRCGVTQPALANAIRALERELGAPLFYRRPKIEITELGRALRPYFQEIATHALNAVKTAEIIGPKKGPSSVSLSDIRRAVRESHATRKA